MGSVSGKTGYPMSFFLAPHFSGWIPIWSMGTHHVYFLAPVFKFHMRRSPRRGTKWHRWPNIDGANSLSWNFIGIPRKPSYSASFYLLLFFWPNSHLVRGYSPSLLILPGLLRSDGGGLSASSPSGKWKDTCGLRRWWLVFQVNQVIQPLFLR